MRRRTRKLLCQHRHTRYLVSGCVCVRSRGDSVPQLRPVWPNQQQKALGPLMWHSMTAAACIAHTRTHSHTPAAAKMKWLTLLGVSTSGAHSTDTQSSTRTVGELLWGEGGRTRKGMQAAADQPPSCERPGRVSTKHNKKCMKHSHCCHKQKWPRPPATQSQLQCCKPSGQMALQE